MPLDMPNWTMTFDWPSIVECAKQKLPDAPTDVPKVGQPVDQFIHSYNVTEAWGAQWRNIQQCKMSLDAWAAGWEAGRAGRPKDPTAK